MIDAIVSIVFIGVIIFVAFGLTWLAVVTLANAKVVRRERRCEPPTQHPDDSNFKRGA